MIPTSDTSTPSNFVHLTRISSTTDNAHSRSRGSSSRAPPRRHRHRFQFSLCTAGVLGLILLAGHPSHYDWQSSSYGSGADALPITGNSLVATDSAAAVIGDTSPQAVLQPHQQPYQRQQQQILALHTSNSATSSAASAAVSGLDGHIRLALSKHASFAIAAADGSNGHSHVALETAAVPSTIGSFADSGRVLASELISELQPPSPQDITTTTINVSKQDEQHLALLDLMTRVSGKSRDQAETEIREERRVTQAAVRKELETRLQLQRQGQDNVAEGDARIELKQVSKLHAGPGSEVKLKMREKDRHHTGEEAKEKWKGRHGKKGKQKKTKGPVKATCGDGNGGICGGIKTTPTIFYVPPQDDDALAMALGKISLAYYFIVAQRLTGRAQHYGVSYPPVVARFFFSASFAKIAIREHIEAGRKVIVHLYSDGSNALLRNIVSGAAPCTLQHPPYRIDLTFLRMLSWGGHMSPDSR